MLFPPVVLGIGESIQRLNGPRTDVTSLEAVTSQDSEWVGVEYFGFRPNTTRKLLTTQTPVWGT